MYIFQYYIACGENYSNIRERDIFPVKDVLKEFLYQIYIQEKYNKKNVFHVHIYKMIQILLVKS